MKPSLWIFYFYPSLTVVKAISIILHTQNKSIMDYNKIVFRYRYARFFELVSSKSDGAVVRSLEDNTTKIVSSRQKFSHLESIEYIPIR